MADQDLVRWGLHTVAVEPCGGRQETSQSSTQCVGADSRSALRSTAPVSPNPPSQLPVPNPYPQFPWQTDAQHQHRQPQQPQPQQQQQQQQHQRQLQQQFDEQRHPRSQQSHFQDRQHKERQHQSRWEQDRQQQQQRRRLQLQQQSAGDHDSTAFGTGARGHGHQAAPQSNWATSQLNPSSGDILHRTGGALGASAGVVQGDSNPGPAGGSPSGMGTALMAFPRASSSISSDEALARALQEELMREPAAAVAAGTAEPPLPLPPLTAAVACSHLGNEAAAATRVNAPHSNRPVPGGGHDDETLARELQEKYLRDAGVDPLVILAEGGPTAGHPSSSSSSPSSPPALSLGTRATRGGAPGLSSSTEPPHIPPLSAPAPSPSLDVRWPEETAGAPSAGKAAAAKSLMTGGSFLCASADSFLNVGPELSEPRGSGGGSSSNSGSNGGCGGSGGGVNGEEEEDRAVAMSIVMNELGLDCPSFSERSAEMRKRLARTPSIRHVMRVNPDPGPRALTDDGREVDSARQILTRRLHQYGLREVPMIGDGNCQFRALADQLWGRSGQYAMVRKSVVKRLKTYSSHYSPYVPERFSDYLKKMSKNGEWGDHITLQAAADHYRAKITLITSYKDSFLVELLPTHGRPVCELWISFYAEVHYNSVYPVEKFPQNRNSGKRVSWFFGLP